MTTSPAATASPAAAASPARGDGWQLVAPGVEWRTIPLSGGALLAARVDPALARIRVAYAPKEPLHVAEWARRPGVLAAINGGYFEADMRASALTVADGAASGRSYDGFGGMLLLDRQGRLELRSLADQPYAGEPELEQALQSFPRLVWDGAATEIATDNGRRAARSVAALDGSGRLLLIACDAPIFTLSELGRWLAASDLGVARALNLDGGPSTGLAINAPGAPPLDSDTPVPQALLIEAP